jgi:hypothetical protein
MQFNTATSPAPLASAICAEGFGQELIPIQPRQKRCLVTGWPTMQVEPAMAEAWLREGMGLGLRTRIFPAIDVDILDPVLAAVAREALAQVFGVSMLARTGRPPKFLIPCRTDSPFKKLTLSLSGAGCRADTKIEVLASGQMYVIHGIHPDTGAPYTWCRGEEPGGVELLAEVGAANLPLLTPERVRDEILRALQAAYAPLGIQVSISGGSAATDATGIDQEALRAPSIARLTEVMAAIPNEADHDAYVTMGRAIRGAAGEDHLSEGLAVYEEWASRGKDGLGGSHPPDRVWYSLRAPHALGWSYILGRAQGHINTAPDVFEADPDAVPPAKSPAPLPTEGERIAAILGDAMPSLYLEVSTLRGAELLRRWETLEAAARTADPLHDFFHSTVLPLADRYRGRERRPFLMLLRSSLKQQGAWGRISPEDQHFLLTAGWAFAAPPMALMGRGGGLVPEVDIFGPQAPRVWIVDGSIPAESVGVVFGPPKARKTFVVTDLAGRIAGGLPFRGRPVQRGGVLYFASESIPQIGERLRAWVGVNGDCSSNFKLVPRALPILDPAETLRQITHRLRFASGDPIRLVVVDVLRSSISDENSNEVMAAATATAQLVGWAFGVAVILVHHSPRANSTRTSGGNALEGGVDWGWGVVKKGETSTVTVRMSRGDDEGAEWHVRIKDGVLRDGGDRTGWDDMFTEKEATLTAGRVGYRLGGLILRAAIKDGIRAAHPSWFGEDVAASTARNRENNAISDAVKAGYLVVRGKGFAPGPIIPEPEEPANLETII